MQLAAFEKAEDEGLYDSMAPLEWKLDKQKDMDGVCYVLRDVGGAYYKDIKECPVVVQSELLEPFTGRMTGFRRKSRKSTGNGRMRSRCKTELNIITCW